MFRIIFIGVLVVASGSTLMAHAQTTTAATSSTSTSPASSTVASPATTSPAQPIPVVVLDARAQERVTNLAANASNRLDTTAARLDSIAGRLASRLAKLQTAGLNTASAAGLLAGARTSLDETTAALATLDQQVADMVSAENPARAWGPLQQTYRQRQAELRTVHLQLRNVVAALKTAAKERRATSSNTTADTASSTDTNPTNPNQ